jgi:hypothetical protein
MRIDVVARRTPNDADVRLGLGPVVQDDRALGLDEPTFSEGSLHRPRREQHRGPVPAVLRLLDEQQPIEELDRVVLVEDAVVHQALVFVAGPPTQAEHRVHRLSTGSAHVNAADDDAARV